MGNEKMERRGSKHLRIAATLELLMGYCTLRDEASGGLYAPGDVKGAV